MRRSDQPRSADAKIAGSARQLGRTANAARRRPVVVGELPAHVTVGTSQRGVAGFRTTHAEATAAQRLCLAASRTPPVVQFADVELLCPLDHDDDTVKRMVTREIGPMLGADLRPTAG